MRISGLILIAGMAIAQPVVQPPSRDIERLLRSKEPSDLAWAAHLAGESGDKKWVPDMIRMLERERKTDGDRKVPLYALETLIQFDAEVPEKVLEPLAHDYFDGIAILLRRDAARHVSLLLRLLDDATSDRERWVWTRVLGSHPTPEYTARLFHAWTVQAKLEVRDPQAEISITTSNFARDYGCEGAVARNSSGKFPPWPDYLGGDLCGATVVNPDEESAWFFGKVAPELHMPMGWVEYRGGDQFRGDARALRETTARYVEKVRAVLIERGLLSKDDPARPQVKLKVYDLRRDKGVPLPEIGGLLP